MNSSQPKLTAETYNINSQNNQMNAPNMPQNYNQPPVQPYPQPYAQPMMVPVQQPVITTTIVTGATGAATRPTFRGNQQVFCGNCQTVVVTNVEFGPGLGTVLICLGLSVCIGLFAFIACCVDDCKDVSHYCCRCGAHVGTVKFMFND